MLGDRKLLSRNTFEEKPSPALSYIIGANLGDGCTLESDWIVKLAVTDPDFAHTFNENMAKLFLRARPNKIQVQKFEDRLPLYSVRYSSRQLFNLLHLPLDRLLEMTSAFPIEFLRGFFDAEGYVTMSVGRGFSLGVGAENSELSLLLLARRLLGILGIDSSLSPKREAGTMKVIRGKTFAMKHATHSLFIGKSKGVRQFASLVGFSIPRKTRKLEDALRIMGSSPPKERGRKWKLIYKKDHGEWVRRRRI